MAQQPANLSIVDNRERGRFEGLVDGEVAGFVDYRARPGGIELTHTEVFPAYQDRGVGSALAALTLDAVRERGATVVPTCPFIARYIDHHQEYADLVAEGVRPRT